LAGRSPGSAAKLAVGIATAVPKLLAYRVLAPALGLAEPVRLVCHESSTLDLLADLSVHKLDLVLTDSPVTPALNIRAYNHLLGESGLSFFAASAQMSGFAQNFPKSLDQASLLLPSGNSPVRRALELWFSRAAVTPRIAAEFDDLALMKVFGEAGTGVFAAPTVVENDVLGKYAVGVIGRTDEVKQHFYAISPERRITHPAVAAITSTSRRDLFG
jgi:LysR family transcriptional activator of nhaA